METIFLENNIFNNISKVYKKSLIYMELQSNVVVSNAYIL